MSDQSCIQECFQEVEVEEFYCFEPPTDDEMEEMFLEAINEDFQLAARAGWEEGEAELALAA